MRKADYTHLAAILREQTSIARMGAAVTHQSPESRAQCVAALATVESIAKRFVLGASVDAAAFLKACGIE